MIIDPPGPLYLAISTLRNITCSIEGDEGRLLDTLVVLFSDANPVISFLKEGKMVVPGIVITSFSQTTRTRALISVNTSNKSIIGLRCEGLTRPSIRGESSLNLTIYGE